MDRSQASATADRSSRIAIFSALLSSAICLAIGIALLYVVFGWAFMTRFTPTGRPSTYDLIVRALAFVFAVTAPTGFIGLGLARLATAYKRWRARTRSLRRPDPL